MVFDVTREETFNNLGNWLTVIRENADKNVIVYLIGNKSDLSDKRKVTYEQAINFAKEKNIQKVFETSSKTGFNVEEVFVAAAKEIYLQVKMD